MKKIVLTGDRPTGPLHLGHYVGSLRNRLLLEDTHEQFIMVADVQALTDNAENPDKVRESVVQVVLDYLAVGIDPTKSTIFIQSMIPEIAELTIFFLNLVSVARLYHNPTVKEEIKQKGFEESIPAGFFMYPVSQAADIAFLKTDVVPVGHDQLPMIEQTNEIIRKFNRLYGDVFIEAQALVPPALTGRLPGLDGKSKMGKSLGNAIFLGDDADTVTKKVMSMYTDPNHLRIEDPGKIEGNIAFTYLDIFGRDQAVVAAMKEHYQKGGLGDVKVKRYLNDELQATLIPIRERRKVFADDVAYVMNLLQEGSAKVRERARQTMREVKKAMKINYF